ncbi:MAG: hypothetical protein HC875_37625 [Anaerolineales bacterium]|nr:hypothetical protein [Anaerolineales bacterium]
MSVQDFIAKRKTYSPDAKVTFHPMDYRDNIGETEASFDLLISQYAGFISQHCKRYLKLGGLLLVNDSHGDASMACLDEDYELIGVVMGRNGNYRITEQDLADYFRPKSPMEITKAYLEKSQRGIGYKKSAGMYLFKRVK